MLNGLFIIFPLKTTLFIIIGHRSHSHGLTFFLDRQTVKTAHGPYRKREQSKCKLKGHVQTRGGQREHEAY